MKKLYRIMLGGLAGAGLNQVMNLLVSYLLHLGYYAPCLVALNEAFGGELNAALMQTLAAALLGAGAGLALTLRRRANPRARAAESGC